MNKKFYTFVAILATAFAGTLPATAQQLGPVNDTILIGSSNEVYYNISAGTKSTVNRKQWDVAFRANRQSASILTNDAAGVELYTYKTAAIGGWATVDTAGLYSWKNMANSTTDWEEGAFCRYQKGHPDYGWGKYNSVTHDVVGDSLFIIKLADGSLRKIWIVKKISVDNVFEFRYANIDGTNDVTVSLDCNPYTTKNFVGYSLTNNAIADFEPVASTQWDLLFSKYMYTYPAGDANAGAQQPVTGVLSNYKVKVKKYEHVAPDFQMTGPQVMDSTRSPIGFDWKTYDYVNNAYIIGDSMAYFVQDRAGKINKLVFKGFTGGSTGRFVLQREVISFLGIDEIEKSGFSAAVYPNPVSNVMNLVINPGKSRFAIVSLLDISGRTVLNKKYELQSEDLSTLQIPVSGLPSGIYMVRIQSGSNVIARKVVLK